MSTHNLCFEQKYEKYQSFFLSENFQFLELNFSIYLNRRIFVMIAVNCSCAFVTLATYSFHRFTKGKVKIGIFFFCLFGDILTKVLQKCSLSSPLCYV